MNELEDIEKIVQRLAQIKEELLEAKVKSKYVHRKTNNLIRMIFFVIGVFAMINLYLVTGVAQEAKVIVSSMVEMYTNFGQMSEQMSQIRQHVESMGTNVKTIPIMAEQMQGMSEYITTIRTDVSGMRNKMVDMEISVNVMNQDIDEMSKLFHSLNYSMEHIVRDVNEISKIVP
jgi:archaellum component FlaC